MGSKNKFLEFFALKKRNSLRCPPYPLIHMSAAFELAWTILKGSKRPTWKPRKFKGPEITPKISADVESTPVPPETPEKSDADKELAGLLELELNRAKARAQKTQQEADLDNHRDEICGECGKISEPTEAGHSIRPYTGNELCHCPGGALDRMKDENQHWDNALPFKLEDEE